MRRKPDHRPETPIGRSAWRLKPLGNQVLVSPLPKSVSPPGLVVRLPEATTASRAQVVAVGPDVLDVHVGQLVLISRLQGVEVGREILLRESAVLAYL